MASTTVAAQTSLLLVTDPALLLDYWRVTDDAVGYHGLWSRRHRAHPAQSCRPV